MLTFYNGNGQDPPQLSDKEYIFICSIILLKKAVEKLCNSNNNNKTETIERRQIADSAFWPISS